MNDFFLHLTKIILIFKQKFRFFVLKKQFSEKKPVLTRKHILVVNFKPIVFSSCIVFIQGSSSERMHAWQVPTI